MKKFFSSWFFVFILFFTITFIVFIIASGRGAHTANAVQNVVGIVFTPFQKAASAAGEFFSDKISYFSDFDELKAENEVLKDELLNAQEELRKLQKYEDENQRLKKYLGIIEKYPDLTLVAAEVIAREPGNLVNLFTIDKGSVDGVKPHDAVITADGLIGYVMEVGATFSKVQSIINSSSVVGAIVSRTRDTGIVEGSFALEEEGRCLLTMLPNERSVVAGDDIETSGLGGLFPKGLIIGRVLSVEPEKDGITFTAVLAPVADFSRIRDVMVVTEFSEREAAED